MSEQTEIGTAVASREERDLPTDIRTGVDINALMMAALQEGEGAVAALEKLVDLEERVARREAERIFGQEFAKFRAELPPIPRDTPGAVRDGRRIMYSKMETIQKYADPLLAKRGFVYRFTTEPSKDGQWLIIECVLHHEAGHSERSSMPVPMTTIPKASKAQEATGTRSYGKRITFSDVLGISTTDDLDGAGAGETIDSGDVEKLAKMADEAGLTSGRVGKLLAIFEAESWADLTTHQLPTAVNMLKSAGAKS